MATKNLDAYQLGVVLDASGATKGISALGQADKAATKLDGTLLKLSKGFKVGIADAFEKELKAAEKMAAGGRASALGNQLGSIVGQGLQNGIGSVFTASNLGKLIGTAIAPGVGTVVGSVIGSGVDAALEKISGPLMASIQRGIELNKQLELAKLHYTAFTGSEKEADAHLDALKKLSREAGLDFPQLLVADQRLEEFNDNVKLSELELRAAADAAAKFGSGSEGFNSIANALGLIAERGELSSKNLLKLYKQGINAPQYIAEALGVSEKKAKELIAKNKLRGDVAAQIIAEGIEVHSGGYAQKVANTTLAGREAQFSALQDSLAQRGTANLTGGLKDVYGLGNSILASSQAGEVVDFLNRASGGILGATKTTVQAALLAGSDVTKGIVQGLASGDALNALKQGITSIADTALGTFKSVLGIQSPSQVTNEQIGVPMAQGVVVGFEDYMANEGGQRLSAAIAGLTQRARAEALLGDPRVRAMLDAIGYSEGTDKKYGYATKVGGGNQGSLERKDRRVVDLGHGLRSSASGRYQFLNSTWDTDARALGLADFSAHAQDLAAVFELMKSGAVGPLLSGNFAGAVSAARHVWASFPGAGYGQGERSLSSLEGVYNRSLAVGGAAVSNTNPMPVYVAGDLRGGNGVLDTSNAAKAPGAVSRLSQTLVDTVPVVIDVTERQQELLQTSTAVATSLFSFDNQMRPVPGVLDEATRATYAYSRSQDEYRKAAIKGASVIENIAGALGQISGLMPQQQVGKKRGFFSKLLGIAAPFLSFIPGIGPIASHLAGIASDALAGNWSGVVSGVAGGLQPGGFLRGKGSSPGATLGDVTAGGKVDGGRASGGPVRRGRAYIVGEYRNEVFEPNEDGYVHPSVESYLRSAHGGPYRGGAGEIARLAEAVTMLHNKLSSVSPEHILTAGAGAAPGVITDAFMRHGSRDPRVVEWMNRRVAGI